ncbi:MAG: leucine-rich repeat domain-containing protein [archaeon]|nr:leucine-rich repeat domain-containing protein [archaeon]
MRYVGTSVELPSDPVIVNGPLFVKWDGYTEGMVADRDLVCHAVFDGLLPEHTVSFAFGKYDLTYSLEYGKMIELPNMVPTKASENGVTYIFAGWDGYTEGMCITSDTVFTASFTEKRATDDICAVTVVYNDGTSDVLYVQKGSHIDEPRYVFAYYRDMDMTKTWSRTSKVYNDVTVYAMVTASGSAGGDTSWTLDFGEGTLTISGTGPTDEWESLTTPWYRYRNEISSLVVEEGVTRLGSFACHKYPNLSDIVLPDSLVSLGKYAVMTYVADHIRIGTGLTSMDTRGIHGITFIESGAPLKALVYNLVGKEFFGNDGTVVLDNIRGVLNGAVWTLDTKDGSFYLEGSGDMPSFETNSQEPWYRYTDTIVSVTVGEGISSLGKFMFYGCTNLVSIDLPNSLKTIAKYAFKACDNVEHISFGNGLVSYDPLSTGLTLYNTKGTTKQATVERVSGYTFDLIGGKLVRTD